MPDGNNLNYINFGQPEPKRPQKNKPHFLHKRFQLIKKKKGKNRKQGGYFDVLPNSSKGINAGISDNTMEENIESKNFFLNFENLFYKFIVPILVITGEAPLVITPKNCMVYKPGNCSNYDRSEPHKSNSWHQIIVSSQISMSEFILRNFDILDSPQSSLLSQADC